MVGMGRIDGGDDLAFRLSVDMGDDVACVAFGQGCRVGGMFDRQIPGLSGQLDGKITRCP